jgi:ATP-dependent Zn protease
MSCNCKTNSKQIKGKKTLNPNYKTNFILRLISFLIGLIFLPVIMVAVIWFMFDLLMLNKEIDMQKIVMVLTSKIKPFNEDDDFSYDENDEDDEFTEENYEILDVEEITPVTRK